MRGSEMGRWVAAVLVALAGLCAGAYVFFYVFLIGQGLVGENLSLPVGGFLGSALPVALAAWVAPRTGRTKIAIAVAAIAVALSLLAVGYLKHGLWLAVVGGAGTVALALWFCPVNRRYQYGLSVLFLGLLTGSFFDWPAWRDQTPPELESSLGSGRFHRYRLSGFLDSEELWRVDAPSGAIEGFAGKLGMAPTTAAPDVFWHLPPYYWPRRLPVGGRLYTTPNFPADSRGPDGNHYFMLLDPNRRQAFVWAKINF